jgi:hypothetical protein
MPNQSQVVPMNTILLKNVVSSLFDQILSASSINSLSQRAGATARTHVNQFNELPVELRHRAKAQLLLKIVEHFDSHPGVTNANMRIALGFDRETLMRWCTEAKAANLKRRA